MLYHEKFWKEVKVIETPFSENGDTPWLKTSNFGTKNESPHMHPKVFLPVGVEYIRFSSQTRAFLGL